MSTLVIIPTYNEREALPVQLAAVRAATPEVHILVADDNSPDGTGEWADAVAAEDSHVHVLHRPGKAGLGAAYIAGFAWGLERGYDVIVEMDADGSHRAVDLPRLLAAADGADLVIGSRWVKGGSVVNWPWRRKFLSVNANRYVRLAMGIKVHDATAGFRAYRAPMLAALDLGEVESQGYCFQVDMTWRVIRGGGSVVEVPITFVERELGVSKMSGAIIREALVKVTVWGVQCRWAQLTRKA
ncbi:polyprenol monophosphomannose synthase [Demequina sp.]|uniref:polyprenol monophosphomannose synthase n=1 Tax=Demequina sp. TaxID=2050685 RepID=UPI003D0E9435